VLHKRESGSQPDSLSAVTASHAVDTQVPGALFFVHPPNERVKRDLLLWDLARGILDGGGFPAVQRGHVDVMGESSEWALPTRREDIVLVICGR
jgi:hypothetical protein